MNEDNNQSDKSQDIPQDENVENLDEQVETTEQSVGTTDTPVVSEGSDEETPTDKPEKKPEESTETPVDDTDVPSVSDNDENASEAVEKEKVEPVPAIADSDKKGDSEAVPDTNGEESASANEPALSDKDSGKDSDEAPQTAQPQYEKWPGEWYVLHTYSGYEDAVAESLKQRIDSLDMQDKIFGVLVPKENQIEIRSGKRRTVEKKIFPGYVLVNMNVTEDSWYVVRNTPSVTGFIGSGTIPVPVDRSEIQTILKRMAIEEPKYKIDLKSGDLVHINDGPFKSYNGTISDVDEERGKIKVLVSIFGRETPVELDFLQVKKV